MNLGRNLLTIAVVPFAITTTVPMSGCGGGDGAAYCDAICECGGCDGDQYDVCLDNYDGLAEISAEQDCEDEFDEYARCLVEDAECRSGTLSPAECTSEFFAWNECL